MTKLTDKQKAFVVNKAAGVANRDAAIAAGYAVAGAAVAADKLMRNPAVRSALKAAAKGSPGDDTKVATPVMPRDKYDDPLSFLLDVMNHADLPIAMRADAAKQLLPYKHPRMGETGKKEAAKERAREIAGGRHKFAPKAPPPRFTVVGTE